MTPKPLTDSEIFRAAAKLPPDQRPAYLDEACGDNRPLRDEVESLLRAHDPDGSFLESPAIAATIGQPLSERPGSMIGTYKLREQIGEGGFGVVYVAEQERPVRRKVALKVIKPGMDSTDVTARFEAERQALALMDHPNVARVLDAGTTDSGRPYFVMELVQGVTITDFCNRNSLSTRQRLALFSDVCRAVQHAHQKGIIHRDLKPSNVMVTLHDGRPVAKVIDFGVSKALSQQLTEKSIYTAYGQMIGTPTYMSPEQAEMSGLGIDTRSDIYSLGVLLYELLTGTTPLDAKRLRSSAYAEMLRLIREEEPPRPSLKVSTLGEQATVVAQQRHTDPHQLRRDLSGELDWIVMKCLEKDRSRRYETATGLARDIERYLSDEPVEACPPSKLYRFKKFTRKHRIILGTLSAFSALFVVASLVSGWLAFRESRANETAQLERAKAERSLAEEQRQRALASQREAEAQTARDDLRQTLYAANMNLIQSSWENQQFGQVGYLLDLERPTEGAPDLRGWEWRFWRKRLKQGLIQDQVVPALVDPSRVSRDSVLCADGSRLVRLEYRKPTEVSEYQFQLTGSGEVVVDDRRSGGECLRFEPFPECTGPIEEVGAILYPNHDASRIAVSLSGTESFLAVFDGNSGARSCNINLNGMQPKWIALSRSGNRLAALLVQQGDSAASSDGQQQSIQVWDVATGEVICRHEQKSSDGELTAAIDPSGTRLLLHSRFDDRTVRLPPCQLLDLSTGEVLWERPSEGASLWVDSWSADGSTIVVVETTPEQPMGSLQLWDASSGTTRAAFLRHSTWHASLWGQVALSPDGHRLAQLSPSGIEIFDVPPHEPSASTRHVHTAAPSEILPQTDANPQQITFSEDGGELVLLGQFAIKAWRLSEVAALRTLRLSSDPWIGDMVRFSPGGGRLAFRSSDRTSVQVWSTADQRPVSRCELASVLNDDQQPILIRSVFSQDGRRLLSSQGSVGPRDRDVDPRVQFWIHDADTGRLIWHRSFDEAGRIYGIDLHPSGERVVTVENATDGDGSDVAIIQIWDVATGAMIRSTNVPTLRFEDRRTWRSEVSYVLDGREIAVRSIQQVESASRPETSKVRGVDDFRASFRFLDADSLDVVRTHSVTDPVARIDLYRERIFVWKDGDISYYDLRTGDQQLRLRGIIGMPMGARSPDGKRVAFGVTGIGTPHEVSIWSLESAQRLVTFPLPGRPLHISFSADGNRLIVAHEASAGGLSITTWDATPVDDK